MISQHTFIALLAHSLSLDQSSSLPQEHVQTNSYSSIINVLVLVLIHHQCILTRTHPSSVYSYSYSSIICVFVLVLIHHQCTLTRTHPSSMYSYSSIINVLVLIHHQCTRTHPSSMYSYSSIINVLVLIHHRYTRTCTHEMYSATGLVQTANKSTPVARSWARQMSSFHVFPASFISFSTVLEQVPSGLPLLLFPGGADFNAAFGKLLMFMR